MMATNFKPILIASNPSHTLVAQKEPHALPHHWHRPQLTHYADRDFSRYFRRAFLDSASYDEADLERPVVGIADTSSDYITRRRRIFSIWSRLQS